MKCEGCETRQQQLLDDGDGSQVICHHLSDDEDSGDEGNNNILVVVNDSPSSSSSSSGSSNDITAPTTSTGSKCNLFDEAKERKEQQIIGTATAINNNNNNDINNNNTDRKRKFITTSEFNRLGDAKAKRKIAPIQNWNDLTVRRVYRVTKIHEMVVMIKGEKQFSYYGEFEDSEECMLNVWLTDIIRDGLKKYKLGSGNVYIKPLGRSKSIKSGFDYNDFVIVVAEN